jgi:hypothetical protein
MDKTAVGGFPLIVTKGKGVNNDKEENLFGNVDNGTSIYRNDLL